MAVTYAASPTEPPLRALWNMTVSPYTFHSIFNLQHFQLGAKTEDELLPLRFIWELPQGAAALKDVAETHCTFP